MTRFLGIDLSQGIQRRHLLAYFAAAFISSSYAGALAMLQPGLLQVMEIAPAQQTTLTGNLSAMQELILIVLLGFMGALADRYGRKPIYVFGLLTTAAGFILYPFASTIGELVLYRIIVAFGSAAMIGILNGLVFLWSLRVRRRGLDKVAPYPIPEPGSQPNPSHKKTRRSAFFYRQADAY